MTVQVGDELPVLELAPLTRTTLALYAGGSGDHVPLHIDSEFAKSAGYPDVFMHGMLGMAYLGRLLTEWAGVEGVRELAVRFVAITYPGEALVARGKVTAVGVDGMAGRIKVDVRLTNAGGEPKITGTAVLQLTGQRS